MELLGNCRRLVVRRDRSITPYGSSFHETSLTIMLRRLHNRFYPNAVWCGPRSVTTTVSPTKAPRPMSDDTANSVNRA